MPWDVVAIPGIVAVKETCGKCIINILKVCTEHVRSTVAYLQNCKMIGRDKLIFEGLELTWGEFQYLLYLQSILCHVSTTHTQNTCRHLYLDFPGSFTPDNEPEKNCWWVRPWNTNKNFTTAKIYNIIELLSSCYTFYPLINGRAIYELHKWRVVLFSVTSETKKPFTYGNSWISFKLTC